MPSAYCLGSHKGASVRKAIEEAGATLLYLPPYSHPIEKAFSKLKALLRRAAERSVEALCSRIGTLLNEFTTSSRPRVMNLFEKKPRSVRFYLEKN